MKEIFTNNQQLIQLTLHKKKLNSCTVLQRKAKPDFVLCFGTLYKSKEPGLWIRIGSGFSDFVDLDPDPYWESGSRGKKVKKFQ
jgi:hypothetical protein